MKINLPFWLNKVEVEKLSNAASSYWDLVASWLQWPLTQMDAETCTEAMLNLLAYQRDITRFSEEPLSLYRLRVKYAFINSVDAGSVVGIKRIFVRLGIGFVEVFERQDNRDWDVIILRLSDTQLSQNHELLQVLMQQYGRTCRRYEFETLTAIEWGVSSTEFSNVSFTDVAKY
ncbi:MAG: phage tail protein [Gammaproteobacteria bacterium]|nr:phage tail protein [Gammaproteobacteria bacterium]